MEELANEFEYKSIKYTVTFQKISSGYPIFFEILEIEPNDFMLPDWYAISFSNTTGLSCPIDANKYPIELANSIWQSILKTCEEKGVSITD